MEIKEEKTGAIFNLDNLEEAAWFDYEGGGKIKLRACSADDYDAIRKKTFKKIVEFKKIDNKLERFTSEEPSNDEMFKTMLWDVWIADWENFYDANMEPIPCTTEMKALLMGKSVKFARFVSQCIDNLTKSQEQQKEEEIKNL